MGKTSFQSLDQLAKNISDNINALNNGQLNNSEIENLTENARDLYERLIVIRHKSYEKFGGISATLNVQEQIEEKVVETPITLEESTFNYREEELNKAPIAEEEMMSFDFSETIQEEVSAPFIEEDKEEIIDTEIKNTHLNESILGGSTSLNDSFKSSSSLADKLNQSKIKDLKSSIDINKKFSFITNLFFGSNEDYNEAINALNNCTDGDEARQILGDIAQKYNWDVEEATVLAFVDLVERRFI